MKLKMYKVTYKKVLDRVGILEEVTNKNHVVITDCITHDKYAIRTTYKCHVTSTLILEEEKFLRDKVTETLRLSQVRKADLLKVIRVTYKVIADNTYLLK